VHAVIHGRSLRGRCRRKDVSPFTCRFTWWWRRCRTTAPQNNRAAGRGTLTRKPATTEGPWGESSLETQTVGSLAEFRRIVSEFPGPDLASASLAAEREGQLTKPTGALARLEEIAAWLATWQGKHPAQINHPRVAVFAG